ncbi:META domain-containing protein [Novosphingobium mangrovi (ex Huang et al. 2023)]|uniref:META domain-containing protein n=1 Tax=Novosphingobium mangrovi (ex Huang et al. 2023) TaxID=2976432 RepID=A0ABT2I3J7_9SPHN|nr:META domain-containing protein [Novosphingobium mangrovi (ex Huang et al. 2023)]MCT2399382.1 META domain-containing protein [Novosphingobium mangrovi (ex Huang et al. 2023)]
MRRLALLLLSVPALVAGCSERGDRSHLAQTSWRFERIDGQQPKSADAELTFDDGKIGVLVGCNRLGGPWRINEKRLVAGPFAQTETACAMPDWNEERAVGALLVATPRLSVDGDRMTLQSSGHTAELVRIENRRNSRKGG